MAHIEDRWWREVKHPDGRVERVKKARYGKGRRWKLRYIDPDDRERTASFDRKIDADNRKKTVEADLLRGVFVDPDAGRVTVRECGERYRETLTSDESSREATARRLEHIYTHLGHREMRELARRPSLVQAFVKELQKDLSPASVRVIVGTLSSVFVAAIDDEIVTRNPVRAKSVKVPSVPKRKVRPWTDGEVAGLLEVLPGRYEVVAVLASGLGLRQGEAFGLASGDVDFLRRVVHVRRQVKIVRKKMVFALPKGGRTRDVPLPEWVSLRLAAHIKVHPPTKVALPWGSPDGEETTAELIVSRNGTALHRSWFNEMTWSPALKAAGIDASEDDRGVHGLRHTWASVQLDGGTSIRAIADYLGHHDPGYTLRVYTHLMPSNEDRARKAVDERFGSYGPVTAPAKEGSTNA